MDGWLAYAPLLGDANANGVGVVAGGYFIPVLDAPVPSVLLISPVTNVAVPLL
jgi:hypothetical protein